MKITRLSTAVIEANYDWVLVRLDAANGLSGIGEAYMGPGVTAILRELASLVVGMDATRPDVLVRRLRAHTIFASPGVVWHAIAGIETACYDLLGKHLGLPVADLLGGMCRQKVPVYVDCHAGDALESLSPLLLPRQPSWMRESNERSHTLGSSLSEITSLKHHGWDRTGNELPTVDDYRRRAVEMVQRGFRTLKFDADIPTPHPSDEYNRSLSLAEIHYVVERLSAVREAIGPQIALAVDCHWNYNVADACRLIQALEPLELLWVEDPIPPDAIAALAQVQATTSTPVATGENHFLLADFLALIRDGKVRILCPDAQKIGLQHTRDVARLAEVHAVPVALHNISGPVGLMAAAHTASSIPNCLVLEWHGASVPFYDHLLADGPLIEDGDIAIPPLPGLGIRLNEEVIAKYAKSGEPFFA